MRKDINFSVHRLIINGSEDYGIESFEAIIDETKPLTIRKIASTEEKEITSILRTNKSVFEDRFVCIYFNTGDKFPYTPKVLKADENEKIDEYDNPRTPDEFELLSQFFVLIDVQENKIYLSDQRKIRTFKIWLSKKLGKEIIIKAILQEEEFISKLRSIESIRFHIVPDLFNSGNGELLAENLVTEILGYDGVSAELIINYNQKLITSHIKEKLQAVLTGKGYFNEVTVIGKDDENLQSILNMDEVISKVLLNVEVDPRTNLFEVEAVNTALILQIKSND